ncbi:MAG TPA: hypothetical protein VNA69_20005 [Thermoanaerobaculia bacterium]|nr:hypothetical protein [Thermoanaerobaculia bacterium]
MSSDIEIYKQKYENFRHFDRLRWQAPGLALAITAGVLAILTQSEIRDWIASLLFFFLAIVMWLCAYLMKRINIRLEENRDVLEKVAAKIGDTDIPGRARHGAADRFVILLRLVSLGCLAAAGAKLLLQP